MRIDNWKGVAEFIGITAIVASLIFVGLQMQQEQEIAIAETGGSLSEEKVNLSILVGQNMEIWTKGLEGDKLSADEHGLFIGLLSAVEMHHQRRFLRWRGIGPGNPDVIARRFAYALYVFPGMRGAYAADIEFVNAMDNATGDDMSIRPWKSSVLSSLAKLDKDKPTIPVHKSYIFWTM